MKGNTSLRSIKAKNNLALHQFLDTVHEDGYVLFCGDRGLMMRKWRAWQTDRQETASTVGPVKQLVHTSSGR